MPKTKNVGPIIFRAPNTPYVGLDANERAHQILATIPGYDQIRASYERAVREPEYPAAPQDEDQARRLLAGESIETLATEYAAQQRHREDFGKAVADIINVAQKIHDETATAFLRSNLDKIRAGVLTQYQRIKTETQKILPHLEGITSGNDLIGKPEGAVAYADLISYAEEFRQWHQTHNLITGVRTERSTPWEHVDILADYPTAWPHFHRYTVNESSSGDWTATVHAERAPWPYSSGDYTQLLRDIAARDLELWAPDQTEYQSALASLNEQARRQRAVDISEAKAERARRGYNALHGHPGMI